MKFVITSLPGAADLLVAELAELGLSALASGRAAVKFEGQLPDALAVCMYSRLAERVLLMLDEATGAAPDAATELAERFAWQTHIPDGGALYLRAEQLGAAGDSGLVATAFLRQRPRTLNLSRSAAGATCLRLVSEADTTILYLDLAGESLQRRGYRLRAGEAPLRETLAAALLRFAGWPECTDRLVDPFCGSGTLLIEAAAMATGRAPGLQRSDYGFMHWPGCDVALWQSLREQARSAQRDMPAGVSIKGFDADPAVLRLARENAERAGVAGCLHLERREAGALSRRDLAGDDGLLVSNPPWGERLGEQEQAGWLHNYLGDLLANHAPGWRAALIGNQVEVLDRTGMKPLAQCRLRNGAVPAFLRLMQPQRRVPADPLSAAGEPAFEVPEQALPLVNRLRKNNRQLRRWLASESIQAWRLYDRDLPEFNFAVDIYDQQVLVQEYAPPSGIDPAAAEQRRVWAVTAVRAALGVHREQVFLRTRAPQKGRDQYQRLAKAGDYSVVHEGRARLLVNLRDYMDTGLFLDHRPMRLRIADQAAGKRMLNLFAYTGAVTVHAACGGASRTVSVDASKSYLEWAANNLALNGFSDLSHALVRADVQQWLAENNQQFDIIFCDPPTFSNSKSREDFSVQRDHARLIALCMKRLEPGGVLYFSCNFRRFSLDQALQEQYQVEDISRWSIPKDFSRNTRIHHCYAIRHGS